MSGMVGVKQSIKNMWWKVCLQIKKKNYRLIFYREREKHQFAVPLIYVFIDSFLHVLWSGIEPATLAYWDDALTNSATQPGLHILYFE